MTFSPDRFRDFVEAQIVGSHLYQVEMRLSGKGGDTVCFSTQGIPAAARRYMLKAAEELAGADAGARDLWFAGAAVPYLQTRVERLLHAGVRIGEAVPVNVVTGFMQRLCPHVERTRLRALASLYQMTLEVERDGGMIHELFGVYARVRLPVCLADLAVAADDRQFLVFGEVLSKACCQAPYPVSALAWQLAFRKIENWGLKYSGRCTLETMVRDLLEGPAVRRLENLIRTIPPRKIGVVGHSFTQSLHWSSPASFTDLAAGVVRHFNPHVTVEHFSMGGQSATTALNKTLPLVLEARPTLVLLVLAVRTDQERTDLCALIRKLREEGCEVAMFDTLNSGFGHEDATGYSPETVKAARAAGAEIIPVGATLRAHPWRHRFEALDVRHMSPFYHKVMAVELLRFLSGRNRKGKTETSA